VRFLAAALLVLGAARPVVAVRGLKHPALSPDGARIAFSWHGDVWVCPAGGGMAERVTEDPADEQAPAWSPDGAEIVFSSDKAGNRDLFVVALKSGAVRQLTFHSSDDDRPAWSPDGGWIAFQSNRDSNADLCLNNDVFDLWRMPAKGGTALRVTRFRGENPAWSPDGTQIAYDRYSSGYGDGEHNLWVAAADGSGVPKEIASGGEDSRRPTWKGGALYLAHEANGFHRSANRNVWKAQPGGGALVQLTGLAGDHVTWPTTCPATDTLVFEYDFDLYAISLKARPPAAPAKLAITAESPYRDDPKATRAHTAGVRQPSWSPTGMHIAGALDGDVVVMRSDGSEARILTRTLEEESWPGWTPDGKALVYASSAWGAPGHLWRVAVDGGEPVQVTKEAAVYRQPAVSPDGRLIAVVREEGSEASLLLVDAWKGAARAFADDGGAQESSPAWSPDATSVAYLRTTSDGARSRSAVVIRPLSGAPRVIDGDSLKSGLAWSPDGAWLAYAEREDQRGQWRLAVIEVATGKATAAAFDGTTRSHPTWSPDSSMLLHEESRARFGQAEPRETLWVRDALDPGKKLQISYRVEKPVSRREEMLSVFHQAWNAYDRNYYDPFFHGADWAALRAKYAPFAAEAQTRPELWEIVNDMIRELRSSHVHLTPAPSRNSVVTGALGAELVRDDKGLKVARVEAGGPAAKAGIREGEVLVGVGDAELTPSADLDRLLTWEAGTGLQDVTVRVSAGGDTREVRLRPIARSDLRTLKYENQIARAKALVREKSAGRLAYHHIKMMMPQETQRLKTAMEKEFPEAEGLILDIRDGVGGMAHRNIISLLDSTAADRINASPVSYMRNRNGTMTADKYGSGSFGGRASGRSWDRPVIMVQNEISRSDKEILPWTFRAAGVGYLVGMPTAGGVIGGNDWTLRDGSRITVSVQGWFTADGRNLEGWGVPPDFRVPMTQEDLAAGRDPQIEKAVEVLLAQMEGKLSGPAQNKKK
jgi:tricorn protease